MTSGTGIPPQLLAFQRQMIDLQRSAFESSFRTVSTIQDRQAEILQGMAEQIPGIPPEMRAALESWTEGLQRARDEYHQSATRSYELLDALFDRLSDDERGDTDPGERS